MNRYRKASPIRFLVLLVLLAAPLAVLPPALAAPPGNSPSLEVGPGPAKISAVEAAIGPDTVPGARDGVILREETSWDDSRTVGTVVRRHVRAKVLSARGRELATIEIPWFKGVTHVREFWGRTILPDGRVLEAHREDLVPQESSSWSIWSAGSLKGMLPGVVPGAIVDYGYEVLYDGHFDPSYVELTRRWPVRELVFDWIPNPGRRASWLGYYRRDLNVKIVRLQRGVRVMAYDLPKREPLAWAPPFPMGRDQVFLHYLDISAKDPREFWNLYAKRVATVAHVFATTRRRVVQEKAREILAARGVGRKAPPEERLRALYEWVVHDFENTSLADLEARNRPVYEAPKKNERWYAASVLERGRGNATDVDYLFYALARAAGLEVDLALVPDRRRRTWEPQLLDTRQFDGVLVAAYLPDQGRPLFLDPGSGMPWGRIPWYHTGVPALIATRKGSRQVEIPFSPAEENTVTVTARLYFEDEGETKVVDYDIRFTGAAAEEVRGLVQGKSGEKRRKREEEACSQGYAVELDEARLELPEDLAEPAVARCTWSDMVDLDPDVGQVTMGVGGPWFPAVPLIEEGRREWPVVLNYRYVVRTDLVVEPPPGMEPGTLPRGVDIPSSWGRYTLVIEKKDDGIHVTRTFRLDHAVVRPEHLGVFRRWIQAVRQKDRQGLAFVRKRGEGTR